MVEITKVGPDESTGSLPSHPIPHSPSHQPTTATSTLTSCIATLTRSICATTAPNHPCYPCVMGTPTSSDLATVTVASTPPPYHTHPQLPQSRPLTQGVRDPQTSCSTSPPEETLTLTIQLCSTCDATIYIGTVPGYTPGGPCHGCTPYSSSPAAVPCTDSSSGEGIVAETTTTTTSTATSTVCDESDTEGDAGTTSAPPGNPGLPTTTSCSDGTGVTVSSTGTVTATAAPPVVTAGVGRNIAWGVVGALVMGVVVVVVVGM